jgi:hypothetical protein
VVSRSLRRDRSANTGRRDDEQSDPGRAEQVFARQGWSRVSIGQRDKGLVRVPSVGRRLSEGVAPPKELGFDRYDPRRRQPGAVSRNAAVGGALDEAHPVEATEEAGGLPVEAAAARQLVRHGGAIPPEDGENHALANGQRPRALRTTLAITEQKNEVRDAATDDELAFDPAGPRSAHEQVRELRAELVDEGLLGRRTEGGVSQADQGVPERLRSSVILAFYAILRQSTSTTPSGDDAVGCAELPGSSWG